MVDLDHPVANNNKLLMDCKKVAIRAVSGSIYVLNIILCCIFGQYGVTLLASLLGILGVAEFRRMYAADGNYDPAMASLNLIGVVLLINACYGFPFILWILWLVWRMIAAIYSSRKHPDRTFNIDMAAQLYIGLPMALLNLFGYLGDINCYAILAIFIIIWVNDTGAFIFGSLFGRHKMMERISPKKTWEGLIGGILCSVGVGVLFGFMDWDITAFGGLFGDKVLFWSLAGLLISIAATYGDLFESMIKRNLNMKDSGKLIPGHGGILDRIDSLLLVIPTMAVYILLMLYFIYFIDSPFPFL